MDTSSDTYSLHTSKELRTLFEAQDFPHQGQHPSQAKILVLGLDANYAPDISNDTYFFSHLIAYHQNGIDFWKSHGRHHPFLLDSYPYPKNTGGVPYHRRFSWMELPAEYAEHLSFIELLPYPTTGRTQADTFWKLFSLQHAKKIDDLIQSGHPRLVLLSSTLMKQYMREANSRYGVFAWLPKAFRLGVMGKVGDTILFGAPHFSSSTHKKSTFRRLGTIIDHYCTHGNLKVPKRTPSTTHSITQDVQPDTNKHRSESVVDVSDTVPDPSNPNLTIPRTWGVWKLPEESRGKLYRTGNYPVRGKELAKEYGEVELIGLCLSSLSARTLAISLNSHNP